MFKVDADRASFSNRFRRLGSEESSVVSTLIAASGPSRVW